MGPCILAHACILYTMVSSVHGSLSSFSTQWFLSIFSSICCSTQIRNTFSQLEISLVSIKVVKMSIRPDDETNFKHFSPKTAKKHIFISKFWSCWRQKCYWSTFLGHFENPKSMGGIVIDKPNFWGSFGSQG